MTQCKKCGVEISWKRTGKQWTPINRDGSVHWFGCHSKHGVDHEVSAPICGPLVTHLCTGELPPWDLGDFRDFTLEEKSAGVICKAVL